jgi:hypothetical protein
MRPVAVITVALAMLCVLAASASATVRWFTLSYGRSVTVGPFRCSSLKTGMRCVVRKTDRGFLIARSGIKRF